MSKSTISTFKLLERFPDEETARIYLEGRLWRKGPVCPTCASGERLTPRIVKESNNNVREALQRLETELLAI